MIGMYFILEIMQKYNRDANQDEQDTGRMSKMMPDHVGCLL